MQFLIIGPVTLLYSNAKPRFARLMLRPDRTHTSNWMFLCVAMWTAYVSTRLYSFFFFLKMLRTIAQHSIVTLKTGFNVLVLLLS